MLVGIRWISQCRHRPHQQNDRVLTGLKKLGMSSSPNLSGRTYKKDIGRNSTVHVCFCFVFFGEPNF